MNKNEKLEVKDFETLREMVNFFGKEEIKPFELKVDQLENKPPVTISEIMGIYESRSKLEINVKVIGVSEDVLYLRPSNDSYYGMFPVMNKEEFRKVIGIETLKDSPEYPCILLRTWSKENGVTIDIIKYPEIVSGE